MTKLYYESHITIDPVFDDAREMASELAKQYKFKLATLIMRKRESDVEQPAQDDTFMTGHSKDKDDIYARTKGLVRLLKDHGYNVRRYKIEDTLVDSRNNDEWGLLHNEPEEIEELEKVRCIEKNWDKVVEHMRSLEDDARNGRS